MKINTIKEFRLFFFKNSRIINQSSEFNSIFRGPVDADYKHKISKQKYYCISGLKLLTIKMTVLSITKKGYLL